MAVSAISKFKKLDLVISKQRGEWWLIFGSKRV